MNVEWELRKARANAARREAYFLAHQERAQARERRREEAIKRESLQKKIAGVGRASKHPGGHRSAAKKLLVKSKSRPCTDCGGTFHPDAMEYDHRDASKKRGLVGKLVKHSVEAVMKEIAKCDLVCANCHRVRTARRRLGLPATLPAPDYEI